MAVIIPKYNKNEQNLLFLLLNNSSYSLMLKCQGATIKGISCLKRACYGFNYCHIHLKKSCKYIVKEGEKNGDSIFCKCPISRLYPNSDYCTLHYRKMMFKTDECVVCLEKFTHKSQPLRKCRHWIHKKCIVNSGKDECPICRVANTGLNKKEMKKLKKVSLRMAKEKEQEELARLREEEESRFNLDSENRIPNNLQEMGDFLVEDVVTIIGNSSLIRQFFFESETQFESFIYNFTTNGA